MSFKFRIDSRLITAIVSGAFATLVALITGLFGYMSSRSGDQPAPYPSRLLPNVAVFRASAERSLEKSRNAVDSEQRFHPRHGQVRFRQQAILICQFENFCEIRKRAHGLRTA